jgi:hypothetical protein
VKAGDNINMFLKKAAPSYFKAEQSQGAQSFDPTK